MPWKLILFLLCLVLVTFFVGFNLDNSCNINLGFKTYENVPIFLTVLISFASGVVIALLFSIGMRLSSVGKKAKSVKDVKPTKVEVIKPTVVKNATDSSSSTVHNTLPKKPSLFDKTKGLFPKKASEKESNTKDATVQTIHLDDDRDAK